MNSDTLTERYNTAAENYKNESEKLEFLKRIIDDEVNDDMDRDLNTLIYTIIDYNVNLPSGNHDLDTLKFAYEAINAVLICRDYLYDKLRSLDGTAIVELNDDERRELLVLESNIIIPMDMQYVCERSCNDQHGIIVMYLNRIKLLAKEIDTYTFQEFSTLAVIVNTFKYIINEILQLRLTDKNILRHIPIDKYITDLLVDLNLIKDKYSKYNNDSDAIFTCYTIDRTMAYIEELRGRIYK